MANKYLIHGATYCGDGTATIVATGSGVTAQDKTDIAAATLAAAQTTPIHADIRKVNSYTVAGSGAEGDIWGPA